MKNKNLLLFLILLVVSTVVFIVPLLTSDEEITPSSQLAAFLSSERYISSDDLANYLVNKDPSIVLIDLRTEADFNSYHIPTAINLPFDQLLSDENQTLLNQHKQTIVFYSNDHLLADNAWFLTNNLGYKNIIVLKDGLNGFYNTILNPVLPTELASTEEQELYLLRKASGIFFGVPYNNAPEKAIDKVVEKPAVVKTVEPAKKVKVEIEEGGC